MRRLLFLLVSFSLAFFLIPNPASAGSCRCTATPQLDSGPNACYPQPVISAADCAATLTSLVASPVGGFMDVKYDNCIYCSDNTCSPNSCEDFGLTNSALPCTTAADCKQPNSPKCLNGTCYYNPNTPLPQPDTNQTGILGIGEQAKINNPSLEIKIPGLNFSPIDKTPDAEGYLHLTSLAEYLAAVYKFALGAASILAAIMIVVNGFRITVSAGGEQKNIGIKHITQAVVGLILLWSSYVLFYTINPELVQFKALKIKYFQPITLAEEETNTAAENLGTHPETTAPAPTGLIQIPNSTNIINSGAQYALPDVVTALIKAVDEAKVKTIISSSYRPAAKQYELMKKFCACPDEGTLPANINLSDWKTLCSGCNGTCQASCSLTRVNGVLQAPKLSHFAGNTVDIASAAEGSVVACNGPIANVNASAGVVLTPGSRADGKTCVPEQQQKLIKAMLNNGFCVGLSSYSTLLREPWHFEYTKANLPVSGFCTDNTSDANIQKLYYVQN